MVIDFIATLQDRGVKLWVEDDRLRCRAPKGVMTSELKQDLRKLESQILEFIQQQEADAQQLENSIHPIGRDRPLPLSFAQQSVLVLEEMGLIGNAYNVPFALYFVGQLDKVALQQSLNQVVIRHEVLRTTFIEDKGTFYQQVGDPSSLDLTPVDLSTLSSSQQVEQLQWLLNHENQQLFNLKAEAPIRVNLFQLSDSEHILLVTLHHIAFDGWSGMVLIKELAAHYQAIHLGQSSSLPPLPVQYADFAVWQRERLKGEFLERQLVYWRQKLQDFVLLNLPLDYPRPAIETFHGVAQTVELPSSLVVSLTQMSQQAGASLFMILLAGFKVLLSRYSGQHQIMVGSPISGREQSEIQDLVGFFANVLVMYTDLGGNPSFTEVLARVRQTALKAYAHQGLPFEKLVEDLQPERSLSHNPLYQVVFALQSEKALVPNVQLPNLKMSRYESFEESLTVRMDLELHLWQSGEGVRGICAYNRDLFSGATIDQLLSHYQHLLEAVVQRPERPINQFPLISDREQQQWLVWNHSSSGVEESTQCLHQLIEAQVEQTPDAVALVFDSNSLTYGELNRQANQLVHRLHELGVGCDSLVGIWLDPGIECVIGMLAIVKAGGAYVPLNMTHRLAVWHQVSVVLTHSGLKSETPKVSVPIICIDEPVHAIYPYTNLEHAVVPQNIAYVLDGVGVKHQSVTHRLNWLYSTLEMSPKDIVLYNANLSSDSTVVELWLPLCHGGRVIIPTASEAQSSEALQLFITDHQITIIHLWPSKVLAWLNTAGTQALDSLRWVLCSGEYFDYDSLQATELATFTKRFGVGIKHYYSLPEAGGEITDGSWQRESESLYVPVGAPGRMSVYVLDAQQQLVPIGVPGEIYVGGPGVTQTIILDNGSSHYGFVEHPDFGRLFGTGERGRRHQDGYLELIDSLYRHVWLKGRRVSLGAIETALLRSPSVDQAYVLARRGELVAYVVAVGPWVPQQLQAHISDSLPSYQHPTHYVPISSLPLTSQGTVDEAVLVQYPVIDDELIQQWEAQLQSLPTIEEVAVVTQPMMDNDPPLHLSDLLPSESLIQRESEQEPQLTDVAERNGGHSVSDTPAFYEAPPLQWDNTLTLAMVLEHTAQAHGETPITYIRADGSVGHQTYRQLWQDAQSIMTGLRQLGLKPQDKVIFQLEDNQDFISAFWGCILGGFIPVPVSIPPSYEQEHSSLTKLHNTWQMLEYPLVLTSTGLSSKLRGWSKRLNVMGFSIATIEALRTSEISTDYHVAQPEDVVLMLLTSGSTGMPKAVTHNHQTLLSRCAAAITANEFTSGDISLNWFPLDHVVGLVMFHLRDVYLGCHQIHGYPETVLEEPTRWLNWLDHYRVTITWAPNFAFELINQCLETTTSALGWDLSSLKFVINGGEAIVAKTARTFVQKLSAYQLSPTVMYPAWGMSETSSGIVFSHQFTLDTTTDTQTFVEVGAPIPGTSIRITDPHQQIVAEEEIGAIEIKGTSVTLGYYQNPEATQAAFTDDGWFNTGDLGFLRNGQLTITGRQKDVIIINGLNYYSHEIEAAVEELAEISPSFTAACAIRQPNSNTDQLAIFFHTPYSEDSALLGILKSIRDQVIQRIGINASYLVPLDQAAIPKTAIGKIQRSKLAKSLMEGEFDEVIKDVDILSGNSRTIPDWFYEKTWVRKQRIAGQEQRLPGSVLVFVDRLGLGDALCHSLDGMAQTAIKVEVGTTFERVSDTHYRVCPDAVDDYHQLCQALADQHIQVGAVVHLWHYDDEPARVKSAAELESVQQSGIYSLLSLVQAFGKSQEDSTPVQLLYGASHTQVVLDGDEIAYAKSTVPGVLKTIAKEFPHWRCCHLDLPLESSDKNEQRIRYELLGPTNDMDVAYRGAQRWVARVKKCSFREIEISSSSTPFKVGGTYVISGGLGGIAIEVAKYLLQTYQARLVLLGRTSLPDITNWESDRQQGDALSEKIAAYQGLQQLGGTVTYQAVDICDAAQVQTVVGQVLDQWQTSLDGVIHLAGAMHQSVLADESVERVRSVLAPKVWGGWVLHQLLADRPDALFIHFSSIAATFGVPTLGAYAAANSFLSGLSEYQRQQSRHQSYCFSWSMWSELGMSQDEQMQGLMNAQSATSLDATRGLQSLMVGLCQGQFQMIVGLESNHPNIRRLTTKAQLGQQLIAFVSPTGTNQDLGIEERGDRFGTPSHCAVVTLDNLPRTETGAIDRDGLAQQFIRSSSGSERIKPRTELEQQIAQIWQDLLGLGAISINDNFFELGGNSLLATQVVSRLTKVCAVEVTLQNLFESPTIEGIAQQIDVLQYFVADDLSCENVELEEDYEEVF